MWLRYIFLPIHKLKQLLKGKACRYDALQLDATTLVTLRKEKACLKSCFQLSELERFSNDLEKWFRSVFVIVSSANGWKDQNILFVFPPMKTLIWRRHCSISQSCCSMTSKRSIDWFLESSSGIEFFRPSVRLTNQKPRTFVSVR